VAFDVLQIITDTDRRGAQVFATDLGTELARQGHAVRTFALAPGSVGGLDVPVLGQQARSVPTLRALRREMRLSDVVVAHGSTTLPACALAGIGTGKPFVYRQISDSRFWAPNRSRRVRVRLGLARAQHVVALWSGAAQVLEDHFGVPRWKITVIANGVPPDDFEPATDRGAARRLLEALGLTPDRFTVLSVGALVAEKGVDLALDAVAGCPDVQLVVVGDGPERAALEARAATVAPGRIRFEGQVPAVAPYYAAADAVLFPSRGGDSMPATLIEAGLMATPAVATPVDAIPEVVVDGVTGCLVPIGDLGRLERAIAELQAAPETVSRLGAAARARCLEQFSIETIAAQWALVLQAVARPR
jgi:glycosyltransferase involved in cell wall biosynthesis